MRRKHKPRRLTIQPLPRLHLLIPAPNLVHLKGSRSIILNDIAHVGCAVHLLKLAHDGVGKGTDVEVEIADGAAHAVDAAGLDEALGGGAQQAADGS